MEPFLSLSILSDSFPLFTSMYIYIYIYTHKEHTISFQAFFVWALLLIVHTSNSSPLPSNLVRLQCTCCTVPTPSWRPHGSPLVWACQWRSSQPFSSPQLSHNESLWALEISKSHREQGLNNREGEELSWCPSWSNSLWQRWSRLCMCVCVVTRNCYFSGSSSVVVIKVRDCDL